MKHQPEIALGYEDVYLVPNKCTLKSRRNVDTSYTLLKGDTTLHLDLPIIPANMKSVVDPDTYEKYLHYGLMPIMHRFGLNRNPNTPNWRTISIGVSDSEHQHLRDLALYKLYPAPHCICIDVAHGHADSVARMIELIIKTFNPVPLIIAGNVTTPEGVKFLQDAGADMVKCGIGGGHVCSTRNKTGFHVPMFTAVMQCSEVATVPIIADGGIRENGDIAKALVAGADLVMVGSLFAACTDSPAVIIDGKKEYYGSASAKNKGYNRNIEGFAIHLTPTMTIEEKVREIKQDLQSAISYSGGNDLYALDLAKIRYNIIK